MMGPNLLSRRAALGGTAAMLGVGLAAGTGSAASAVTPHTLDLGDPRQRARARAKVMGSAGEETVPIFYRLHLYAYLNDGGLIPLFTLNHLSVTDWRPLANGNHHARTWECGVYCRFDTDEVLDVWANPVTGETLPVWKFLGGPFTAEVGPDGATVEGAELKPQTIRMETIGDMLMIPMASSTTMPNPMTPAEWPTQSAGATRYWESQATYSARLADVADPRQLNVAATCTFQNMGSWHPWLGMGSRPGRTYGRAYGAKLRSLDDLPAGIRAGFEKKTPEIFDTANWTKPRLDIVEFLAGKTPR
ncbi:DUF1838 family protein [Sphingomonas sp. OK281]|uniref:DUF1838 family protein n=1 Tax=Sphingomonas sp. OK281 TaxID=1881067 RepID=UPI0008E591AF|nr:DUF1838 family protein [Sphingomonas sp. OK281]SFO02513.1 Protein of unknown function [Sphingomonas sp. OK281]